MSSLAALGAALGGPRLPAITSEALAKVRRLEAAAIVHAEDLRIEAEQLLVATEHVFHAGMYARTVRLKPGTLITGALIKRATLLIVSGPALMLLNDGTAEIDGYNVFPAGAGRKQVFLALANVAMTMIFPTTAKTVEEAEAEFTDETELLLSRRQDNGDTITITGE